MATIYLVKNGEGSGSTDPGTEVSIQTLLRISEDHKVSYYSNPPIIKSGPVNPYSAYLYVVAKVQEAEATGKFSKEGYYHIIGLTPSEFQNKNGK